MAMRVTQSLLFRSSADAMQTKYQQMSQIQERSLSGSRVNRPSDDPTATFRALTYESGLSEATSLRKTTDLASSRMGLASEKIGIMHDRFLAAEDLVMKLGNDYQGGQPTVLKAASKEALALYQDILKHANAEMDDVPLFSGGRTSYPFSDTELGVVNGRIRTEDQIGFTPAQVQMVDPTATLAPPPGHDVPASVKVQLDANGNTVVNVNGQLYAPVDPNDPDFATKDADYQNMLGWLNAVDFQQAGFNANQAVYFEIVPRYQGGAADRQVKISDNQVQNLPGNVTGAQLMEGQDSRDQNLLGIMAGLQGALSRADTKEVNSYLSMIHEGRAQVSDWQSITGIRQLQVEGANTSLVNEELLLSDTSAKNSEIDMFSILTELEQTTQAMQVMTLSERELLNTSLVNFIG